jgi:membrane fusion protein, multidrug efflux system
MTMRQKGIWGAGLLCLVILVLWLALSRGAIKPDPRQGGRIGVGGPPVVEVITVTTGRITQSREAIGTVRALEAITVTAKVSGILASVDFREGQQIKEGEIIARLDAEERRAEEAAAKADLARTVALKEEIAQKFERARALRRSGAGTEAQVDDFAAQLRTAESAIMAARARVQAAAARLEDLVIRAPFSGRLGGRSISQGAYIAPGGRITTLDDLSRVRVDFSMPENISQQLHASQQVHASGPAFGERRFAGRVALIDPRIDPMTRAIRLTADIANPDEALRPGMFLNITIDLEVTENAILVPEEAILGEGLRQLLFVIVDGKAERRLVRIGQRQGGKVQILEGLSAGETLVVRGLQRIRPGQPVVIRPIQA